MVGIGKEHKMPKIHVSPLIFIDNEETGPSSKATDSEMVASSDKNNAIQETNNQQPVPTSQGYTPAPNGNAGGYPQNPQQSPPYYDASTYNWAGYQNVGVPLNERMMYHAFKTNYDTAMRVQEERIRSDIKVEEDARKLQSRLEYNEKRKENDLTRVSKVYIGPGGVPMIETRIKDEIHGTCVEVIPVMGYMSKVYVSSGKPSRRILEVWWNNCIEPLRISLSNDSLVNEKLLISMIKERGVQVTCPRIIKKAAMDGLYSETIRNAEIVKIPYRHGWNVLEDGSLCYVFKEEMTIQEVSKNARGNI